MEDDLLLVRRTLAAEGRVGDPLDSLRDLENLETSCWRKIQVEGRHGRGLRGQNDAVQVLSC